MLSDHRFCEKSKQAGYDCLFIVEDCLSEASSADNK